MYDQSGLEFSDERVSSYFWAAHSQARLKTTRKMLVRTLTYHQVMPGYLNFVSVFGQQTKPHNARFSGFREQTVLSTPLQGQAIHDLGRSGRQFQLCYNLKSVSRTSPEATVTVTKIEKKFWRWSTRQVALCHQFDTVEGTTLWILTKGGLDLKERIQEMTGSNGRREDRTFGTPQECFQSSLAVHLLLAHWANEGWRWYIQWLEDVIEEEVSISGLVESDYTENAGLRHIRPLWDPEVQMMPPNFTCQKIFRSSSNSRKKASKPSWFWKRTSMYSKLLASTIRACYRTVIS